jgi:hypothetical protein
MRSAASSNDQSLTLEHLITLSPENATRFYWTICGLSFVFVAAAILMAIQRVVFPQTLTFSREGLSAPKYPWASPSLIPYSSIIAISTTKVGRQEFIKIVHEGGKQTISAAMLESPLIIDDVRGELRQRLEMCSLPTVPK